MKKIKEWFIRDAYADLPRKGRYKHQYRIFGDFGWLQWRTDMSHFAIELGPLWITVWKKDFGK